MSSSTISPARHRRRAVVRLLQKIQHAAPGLVLIQEGTRGLAAGAEGWHLALAVAELATAGAVLLALVVAIRRLAADIKAGRPPHLHFGIDWVDIFLGLMLFTEVASRYPVHHKIWSPAALLGLVMIFLGLFGGRIAKRRAESH